MFVAKNSNQYVTTLVIDTNPNSSAPKKVKCIRYSWAVEQVCVMTIVSLFIDECSSTAGSHKLAHTRTHVHVSLRVPDYIEHLSSPTVT